MTNIVQTMFAALMCGASVVFSTAGLTGCAVVDSGYRGVAVSPNGHFTTLPEGASFVVPFTSVRSYDLRQRGFTAHFFTLTADGVSVETSDSLVTYHIVKSEIVPLAREVGPNYESVVIVPIVQSVVRRVLASYRWSQLDSRHIREANKKITKLTAVKLRPYHIVLESVLLRNLEDEQPLYEKAVIDTSVMKQYALRAQTEVKIAKRRAEQRRIEAKGIVAANNLIAPTLTKKILKDDEIKTWRKLVDSPNTQVKILETKNSELEVTP